MIAVAAPRRLPAPTWAVWSLMAGLASAAGLAGAAEGYRVNALAALFEALGKIERGWGSA